MAVSWTIMPHLLFLYEKTISSFCEVFKFLRDKLFSYTNSDSNIRKHSENKVLKEFLKYQGNVNNIERNKFK